MFENELMNLGLSEEQTEIYLSLLENGAQSATKLAGSTSVKRTYVYKICDELVERGLVSQEVKGRTTVFAPLSPDYLLSEAEQRKQEAKQAQRSLERILPNLKAKFSAVDVKPVITYFEGPAGIMKANMEILAEQKTILAYLLINEEIDQEMDKDWIKYYEKRVKDKIHVRAITPDTPAGHAYKSKDKEELRITRLVPKEEFPFTIEKNICGNKVAFFAVRNNILVATIIENQEIADSERSIFELSWIQAKRYSKNKI